MGLIDVEISLLPELSQEFASLMREDVAQSHVFSTTLEGILS